MSLDIAVSRRRRRSSRRSGRGGARAADLVGALAKAQRTSVLLLLRARREGVDGDGAEEREDGEEGGDLHFVL